MVRLIRLLMFVLLLGAAIPAQAQTGSFSLTILHTNDVHATYEADSTGYGGVARQATLVQQIRSEVEHVLLVDAGDRFTGSVFHSFHQGRDSVEVMNLLGYDAMVLGSYEFTHGAERLSQFVTALHFPVVVANVDFSRSPLLDGKIAPYSIQTFDGEPVGIIGVTRGDSRIRPIPELGFDTQYANVVQTVVDDLAAQGVNRIVLLSHLGYYDDLGLARAVSGVDVIVGGDTNTLLSNTSPDAEGPYPAVIESAAGEPVLVVQAWQRNRVLGRLDVTFDAAGVLTEWTGDAIFLTEDIASDPAMDALIERLRRPILDDFLTQVIGGTEVRLEGEREVCRFEECNMGNLITDAMRVATGTQIAFQNGGGIRASLAPGPITVGNVLEVLPFSNTYVYFEMQGIDVIAALENSVSRVDSEEGTGRFLQVSGLRFAYDGSRPVGQRIANVEVLSGDGNYEPLDPDEVYTISTNDFLFAGADDFTVFAEKSANSYDYGRALDEIVRTYITQISPINIPQTEGRIIRLDR